MKLFDFLKGKNNHEGASENYDFSETLNDNDVEKLVKSKKLVWIYIMAPMFGGAEDRGNQIVTTPQAAQEKQMVDETFKNFLVQGKSVQKLNINYEYKDKSVVASKIITTAIVDGNNYEKVIEVW